MYALGHSSLPSNCCVLRHQVVSKTEQETYREQMAAWEREQERQIVEFTITEDNLDADQHIPVVVPMLPSTAHVRHENQLNLTID